MRTTIQQVKDFKTRGEKFAMLTAYDYPTARIIDRAGIPVILVGDSLGTVVLGYETTIPVTMDEMIHHTKAVVRGTEKAMVVADMPFMTYHITIEETLRNAARFIQEARAQAVKLEGGVTVADKVKKLVDCGIPVMGHIGLTPQSFNQLSGHKIQGRSPEAAKKLLADARALETAGAFSIVLEGIPAELAALYHIQYRHPDHRHRRWRRLRRPGAGGVRSAGSFHRFRAQARRPVCQTCRPDGRCRSPPMPAMLKTGLSQRRPTVSPWTPLSSMR